MKKFISIIFLVTLVLDSDDLWAQLSGRKFVSGLATVYFSNLGLESGDKSSGYGLGFDVTLGKFRTENRASGWRINGSFRGASEVIRIAPEGNPFDVKKSGLRDLSIGGGYFWQFYKHFDNKLSVSAGPGVDLSYRWGTNYGMAGENGLLQDTDNSVSLSIGLGAQLLYRFSDKWWAIGSLAFSNPVSIEYVFHGGRYSHTQIDASVPTVRELNYNLTPSFSFPSVGLGLRYFPGR